MADPRIHVVGVQGGEVQNSNVAGVVHDGMGNKTTTNQGPVSNQDFRGTTNPQLMSDFKGHNMAFGQHGVINDGASSQAKGTKDPKKLSSSELVNLLREAECSEDTIKIFTERRITGRMFMSNTEELLKKLSITDDFEIMRINDIKEDLSG